MYRCLSVISELGMLAEDLINMIAWSDYDRRLDNQASALRTVI
jgi:hypothetical protein